MLQPQFKIALVGVLVYFFSPPGTVLMIIQIFQDRKWGVWSIKWSHPSELQFFLVGDLRETAKLRKLILWQGWTDVRAEADTVLYFLFPKPSVLQGQWYRHRFPVLREDIKHDYFLDSVLGIIRVHACTEWNRLIRRECNSWLCVFPDYPFHVFLSFLNSCILLGQLCRVLAGFICDVILIVKSCPFRDNSKLYRRQK